MTLRTKASFLISFIIIFIMSVSGIYYLYFLQRSLKDSILAGVAGVSDSSSQAISKFLADSLKETQAIALALPVEALEKKDTSRIRDRLKSLLDIFPKFDNGMFILDKDGRLWVDYPQNLSAVGTDFSSREYFKKTLKEEKGIIGVPYVSGRTGKPVITFTTLLRGSNNQVLGVLGCSVQMLSPDALGGIRQIKIGRTGYIFVFDTSRMMILHPENERVLKPDIPLGANKLLDAAVAGFEGVGETTNSRGIPMLAAFKRIPGTDWIIAAQQPQDEAFFPITKARRGLILGIIVMVMVGVVAVALAIHRITKPLTKLRQAVTFWGKEESAESQKVAKELEGITGSDEIGELANAFLDISKKLDKTLISLKDANNDWERTFNAVPDLIAIIDRQHTIVKINQAMADRLKVNAQDVVGLKCYKLFHGTDEPLESCPHQRLLEDGQEHIEELVEKGLDATFLITASPLSNQAGELIGSVHVARDISERKRMEEELQASEEKYRMVGEYNYDWEYWISPTGTLIYISPSCQRITGYAPEDFIANPRLIAAIVHPEDQETIAAHLQEAMQESLGVCEVEFRILTKDGEERWLRHVCQPVYRDQDIWVGRRASNRDITKRKQAEETLRNTLDYLENTFANSADGIGIVDQNGKFTRWNKAAEELYGYTFEELKGRSAIDLYADSGELEVMLKQLRQHGFIRNYEINMKKKDGSFFPASLSIKVLRNSNNEIIGSITGSRDLSETKLMMKHLQNEIYQHEQDRQALLVSEQKLANIIDFLPDATFVIDTKGEIIAWNKAIEEMTGGKAKDMVGKGNYEYALPFYGERRPILIDLVLESQKGVKEYDEVKREPGVLMAVAHLTNFKGKETYLFGKASALIDSHGNIIGSIETIRDITALRKAEADRLQYSKLESLSILAGGIAHDFNNILTAILGNISLAILDGKIEPQVQDRLSRAEQACLRAQGLSQQLLTFAKGGAPIKKIVSIANLLKESANLTLSGSKSRCDLSIPEDLWPVDADAAQINQVFNNLLINADQAMPEGGIIKITGENCLVEAESNLPVSKGKYVKFAIADQGTGISPKYLDKIYDPYFSTKQKGSGLGLATAYSIIKNHSGHIKVESQIGVGTTFTVYLPALEAVAFADEQKPKPDRGQGRVLVMDDEEMVGEVFGRMLDHLGYEVDFASDGSQAIEKFVTAKEAGRPFAAVILDLTIPGGMGGKETIDKLLKIDPQVKAIVSSGYSDDPIMAEFAKYGFSGVIAKPYRIAELGRELKKVISKVK